VTDETDLTALEEALPTTDRPARRGLRRLAVDVRPLTESRDFRLLWAGQSISFLGSMVTFVALPVQMYRLTGSTLDVGLLSLADAIPLITLAAIGGTIADAFDRRRLVLLSEAGLALVAGGLALNAAVTHPQVWALYLLAAVGTSLWALGSPALRAMMPGLVPDEQLTAANALQSVYYNLGAVVGPAIGGLLVAGVGFTGTYLVDFGSFAASLATVVLVPSRPRAEDAEGASFALLLEGLRFLRSRRVILGTFVLDTNAMIFGMPQALFPAIAVHHFHGGARVAGLLYAAPSAGALAAALLSGWMVHVRRQGIGVAVAIGAWGGAIAAFGFATVLWLGLVLLALAGAADSVSATLRSTILYANTPDAMRGRMSGIELAQVASTPALGNVEAGAVAAVTSLRFSVVSGGVACIAGAALILLALPGLVRYDARELPPEVP
jgi:MFS family permease